ncbi:Transcriptional regulator containing PAS, AAA-type ATPase, and DNA-binding Fis domains [Caldanaerovirga acetigignens]|uniref:Transcriptional regulator containing PAS, AAA-type ATPase, and DNA-binding Fis domains n=1 Tax=Caldanaerovirga acetigignens TaxID=447595 RepID=A0A1M7H9H0_9FIRM|nr:sigma 54-interacting transcriptional regulator [Caldanaerovirga acetigignens]SHM25048.1 Transcriptional regulator containing PAS, AAA-type ATPase, and DNA-binding Fis domains [Caldanaerovirga acetigignens]
MEGRGFLHLRDELNLLEKYLEIERTKTYILESILMDSPEGIIVIDAEGYVAFINRAYILLSCNRMKDAIVGKRIDEVFKDSRLISVIKTGKGEIVEDSNIIKVIEPILKEGRIVGAIERLIDKKRICDFKSNPLNENKGLVLSESLNYEKGLIDPLDKIIGCSNVIKELKSKIAKIANTDSTVLITGESGTGKEVVANVIHELSPRKGNNLVKINCAAIPANILESELFGYEDGAFTGARKGGKAGKFELADKGTIFLDEIGEMCVEMQAKLLRVLQEREIERIGGSSPKKVDVRIIAATNQDLEQKVSKGEFREDLYYRLNVVRIHLPPLRERVEDIPLICNHLLKKYSKKFGKKVDGIEEKAMEYLKNYSWPGNVRELENVIERAFNFIEEGTIKLEHLPEYILKGMLLNCIKVKSKDYNHTTLSEIEKQSLINALKVCNGNKSRAARMLGISRAGLYQKLRKYGIEML